MPKSPSLTIRCALTRQLRDAMSLKQINDYFHRLLEYVAMMGGTVKGFGNGGRNREEMRGRAAGCVRDEAKEEEMAGWERRRG